MGCSWPIGDYRQNKGLATIPAAFRFTAIGRNRRNLYPDSTPAPIRGLAEGVEKAEGYRMPWILPRPCGGRGEPFSLLIEVTPGAHQHPPEARIPPHAAANGFLPAFRAPEARRYRPRHGVEEAMHPTGAERRASILRRLGRRPCLGDDGRQASHLVIPLAAGRERTDEGQIDQGGGILGVALCAGPIPRPPAGSTPRPVRSRSPARPGRARLRGAPARRHR
jgi:hypothetical protein